MIWKKLDMMLVKGFIPPFLLSFLIAMFVLVMQTLWLYIDDIIGKGAGFWIIVEFLLYLSFSMIPWALPIGVLLAGVFQFGNLGERYELSSMKSAGISLLRIMRPLILLQRW
ncbi:MAG: LptF/LptG family permease [Saprospiraceae bacterium]|nr:LptF/LptG family permease [Saprospiraceae bacterium]